MSNPTAENYLAAIRERVEAQRNRYGARWNQILHDRAALLAMVDERDHAIFHLTRCQSKGKCSYCRRLVEGLSK